MKFPCVNKIQESFQYNGKIYSYFLTNLPTTDSFVYCLSELDGSPRYVGKTQKGLSRIKNHLWDCSRPTKGNNHKKNWLRKLVKEKKILEVTILEENSSNEILNDIEIFYISYFQFLGFNLVNHTKGGEGISGYKHSEETRKKSSQLRKGKAPILTEEARRKISLSKKGKPLSEQAKLNMSKARKGRKFSPLTTEHRQKLSKSNGGSKIKDQNGVVYDSSADACRKLNLTPGGIYKVLLGKYSHTGGYTFTKVEE